MMIKIKAPAKINLALDIKGKREDGYHYVEMIMQSIDLFDIITIEKNDINKIELLCDYNFNDDFKNNIVYKAAKEFFCYAGICNNGVNIKIEKNIPVSAGLAGGSSDAAATLVGLNNLFDTKLTLEQLISIGSKLGADVPFCICGGTMLSTGIGTTLKKISSLPSCYILLAKPEIGVSTKEAYEKSDKFTENLDFNINNLVNAIDSKDINNICANLFNRFEKILNLEEVNKIKNIMNTMDAVNACMSGSGSTVFGIFVNKEEAHKCEFELKKYYDQVFLCVPISNGCVVE